jgi:hypothetical protein
MTQLIKSWDQTQKCDLYWKGTLNCGGTGGTTCTAVVLPDCRDSPRCSFGGIAIMQFLRDLVSGRYSFVVGKAESMKAYAHYLNE